MCASTVHVIAPTSTGAGFLPSTVWVIFIKLEFFKRKFLKELKVERLSSDDDISNDTGTRKILNNIILPETNISPENRPSQK